MQPVIIIHGGMGAREGEHAAFNEYAKHLDEIIIESYEILKAGTAINAVRFALRKLEDDPLFNAGTGSRLQSDGVARMSAAIMNTANNIFSGVINIERVKNPIEVAWLLAGEQHTVLSGIQATQFAREKGFEEYDPITVHRLREFKRREKGRSGTVGAVALDVHSVICAGTSTGGMGFEIPGRVSDSATVAGTYARNNMGISCTGIGEDIINHAAAARIAVRVADGRTLQQAAENTFAEAERDGFEYGCIALNGNGDWVVQQTRDVTTLYAVASGDKQQNFLA